LNGVGEKGERRWPMAFAVITAVILTALLPGTVRPESRWLLGVVGLVLITLSAVLSTAQLVHVLVVGDVWVSNNIVFALIYWEVDGGGSVARAMHPREYPDLAFPQQMNPQLPPPGWRPMFIDYLYLGSPTASRSARPT
jgi:hypothetical protein